jgi:hypothetical protein
VTLLRPVLGRVCARQNEERENNRQSRKNLFHWPRVFRSRMLRREVLCPTGSARTRTFDSARPEDKKARPFRGGGPEGMLSGHGRCTSRENRPAHSPVATTFQSGQNRHLRPLQTGRLTAHRPQLCFLVLIVFLTTPEGASLLQGHTPNLTHRPMPDTRHESKPNWLQCGPAGFDACAMCVAFVASCAHSHGVPSSAFPT